MQTVPQRHQKPLSHRKLQVVSLSDDQHVWAGQGRVEVVQVDLTVVRHDPDTDVQPGLTVLAEEEEENKKRISSPSCWSEGRHGRHRCYCRCWTVGVFVCLTCSET